MPEDGDEDGTPMPQKMSDMGEIVLTPIEIAHNRKIDLCPSGRHDHG